MLGDHSSSLSSSLNEFSSSLQDTQIFEGASIADGFLESDDTIKQLTNAWMNERNSPELLTYKGYLVNELVEALDFQANRILETPMTTHQDKLNSMLYQNEIERIKFIIKSYLRTRLHKIEKCTLDLLRNSDIEELMSDKELAYAKKYQQLVEQHNHDSFLHTLPQKQHKQDERSGDLNMVVTSNLEAPVFIKVLDYSGNVQLANDDMVLFEKDDIFILRYADIRSLLLSGHVRLL
ncbi:hypothetical protein BDA99DRAFT_562785 [Phascolomyces articulosus]|uniref:DNA replication complex GINS protein SLD5 n=1 Tax=Phascolomyces articulosus TaxID=60185 RepID=A0AAD5K386_9FUNG|nr:hypothetical protein BDA99DRAFT_562785 [Phascolomyces articulosus]